MSRVDRILIVAFSCIALAATPVALALEGSVGTASYTVIIEGPGGTSRMSLVEDEAAIIEGSHGPVTVETVAGAVRVAEATCPDRTCIKTGWVRAPGSAIVCIPNGVTIRIGGARDDDLDAVIR